MIIAGCGEIILAFLGVEFVGGFSDDVAELRNRSWRCLSQQRSFRIKIELAVEPDLPGRLGLQSL